MKPGELDINLLLTSQSPTDPAAMPSSPAAAALAPASGCSGFFCVRVGSIYSGTMSLIFLRIGSAPSTDMEARNSVNCRRNSDHSMDALRARFIFGQDVAEST